MVICFIARISDLLHSHGTGHGVKFTPGLPKSREEVHNAIGLMDTRTSKDEEFVITNYVPSGLIIFSCSSDLEFLTNSAEEIFVVGTFSFCPNFVLPTVHHSWIS